MKYRADIDGLRGLAVLPVVLFHLQVPPFGGGFVGVDVFFVISGYLITGLIAEEIRQGRFSILNFYERRVRRILPALFLVLFFCILAAILVVDIGNVTLFGESLMATVAFLSNVDFYLQSNYFDPGAHTKPLLHTWSLAVEEQYYVVFPVFMLIVWRWFGRRWVTANTLFLVASFGLSVWLVAASPSAAFFLGPSRNWELLVGALLALGAIPPLTNARARDAGSIFGLLMIAAAVFVFSKDTPFPGAAALLPCLGTALLIHTAETTPTAGSRLLSLRPVVFVGLISYSLYLWHWPLIVFAGYLFIDTTKPLVQVAIVALSFTAAWLSWRFVERPFRTKAALRNRWLLFGTAVALTVVLALIGRSAYLTGWPERFGPEVRRLVAYSNSVDPRLSACPFRPVTVATACTLGAAVSPSTVLWGDSHALSIAAAVAAAAERHDQSIKFIWTPSCPPIEGVSVRFRGDCHSAEMLDEIVAVPELKTVILVARYALYIEGPADKALGPAETWEFNPGIVDGDGRPVRSSDAAGYVARQFALTVNRLVGAGKRVVIVYPVPETGYDIPRYAASMVSRGEDPASFTRPFPLYAERQREATAALDGAGASPNILRLHPEQRLCDAARCIVFANGEPLYRDDHHLSVPGNAFISPLFDPVFAN